MNYSAETVKSAIDSLPEEERGILHWMNNPEMQREEKRNDNFHEKLIKQAYVTQEA
jgi:hypothetical protein